MDIEKIIDAIRNAERKEREIKRLTAELIEAYAFIQSLEHEIAALKKQQNRDDYFAKRNQVRQDPLSVLNEELSYLVDDKAACFRYGLKFLNQIKDGITFKQLFDSSDKELLEFSGIGIDRLDKIRKLQYWTFRYKVPDSITVEQ